MTTTRRLVFGIVAATTMTLAGALPAFAVSGIGQPSPNPSWPATTNLAPSGTAASKGVSPNLVLGVGNCYGQTFYPHASTHYAQTSNVEARTVCATQDYVETALYRSRWWGWEFLGNGNATAYGTAQDHASGPCAPGDIYTYLADSYHSAANAGVAYTSNSNTFKCP